MAVGRLVHLFDSLLISEAQAPAAGMVAVPIPGFPSHRLGRQPSGAPAVLLKASGGGTDQRPNPVRLEHVTIQHDVRCRLSRLSGHQEEGLFSVVRCSTPDEDLRFYFLTVMDDFV